MNRVIKNTRSMRSRYGFTLLEVVLAIAIMLILTTMMMNGFAATMSYSYHTSIYARTGASNYKSALSIVANNSDTSNPNNVYKDIDAPGAAGDNIVISMNSSSFNRTMNARRYSFCTGTETIDELGYASQKENHTNYNAGDNEDGTYANNRFAIYYVPKYNIRGNDETTRGQIVVYRRAGHYYWYDSVHGVELDEITS